MRSLMQTMLEMLSSQWLALSALQHLLWWGEKPKKIKKSLWELLQFSLASVGDFSHSKLQKNVLHLTKDTPVKSNCVALRDPYRQIIQPPRIMFIYFKIFLFYQSALLFMHQSKQLIAKKAMIYFSISQQHCSHILLLIGMQILCLYWYNEVWQVVSRFIDAA